MKRISLWILSTVALVVLMFGYHTSTAGTLSASSSIIGTLSLGGQTTTSAGGPPANTGTTGSGGNAGSSNGSGSGSGSGSGNGSGNGKNAGNSSGSGSGGSNSSANGTVDGNVVRTMWGPVQVEIDVSGGKISNVKVLQAPHGNPRDIQIDNYVLPILVKETISAQSSNIQMISGATYTSGGYIQSLQSALDKAGI